MPIALPNVIDRYQRAADNGDVDGMLECFSEEATVIDERETYSGHAAIRLWRETVASRYRYTVDVLGVEATGDDEYVVTTHLEGDFPGGTVDLRNRFVLRSGKIAELEIAP